MPIIFCHYSVLLFTGCCRLLTKYILCIFQASDFQWLAGIQVIYSK